MVWMAADALSDPLNKYLNRYFMAYAAVTTSTFRWHSYLSSKLALYGTTHSLVTLRPPAWAVHELPRRLRILALPRSSPMTVASA